MSNDPRVEAMAEYLWSWNPIPVFEGASWSELVELRPNIADHYRAKARLLFRLAVGLTT